jgi:hypothetical protein
MKRSLLILTAVLALTCAPALRAEPAEAPRPPIPDLSQGSLDAATLAARIAEATPERFPDADAVYADSVNTEFYREDGTGESWGDVLIVALTEKGCRENQSLQFGFHEAYGDVRVYRLDVHKKDGRVLPVDIEGQSRVMVAPDQMASNIFDPRQKVLLVGIPGLEPGDAFRAVIRRRTFKVRMPGFWGDWASFENTLPLLRDRMEVYAPSGFPLKHRVLKDEIPGTVTYEETALDGWTRHVWTAQSVPQLFEEPNMPPAYTVAQRLLLSTLDDWREVSRWYWNLSKPRIESTTPEMRKTVEDLVRDKTDRKDRIRAIFQFVSQQIRYMGITPEAEAPGYEPHDVSLTFENRYGVCRDKAALLAAMLRVAGFEAFPVLIDTGAKKDLSVPQPFFNHAITAVREPDGSYLLMDSTDETTRDLLPTYLCNRSFLVATPEGEALLTSPVPPAEENLLHIRTEGDLQADGTLRGVSTLRFEGINDNAYRGFLARQKPDERKRFFEGLLKRAVPGAKMTGWTLTPDNLQDMSASLTARLEFEAPDYPIAGERAALLPPPWFGTGAGMVNFILGATGLTERRFPLVNEYACGTRETFRIRLPEGFADAVSFPQPEAIRRATLEWNQSLSGDTAVLEGEAQFLIRVPEFSPGEYRELKQDLSRIETEQRRRPVFTKSAAPAAAESAEPDARTLRNETRIEVLGPGSWRSTQTVSREILSYAGVKNNAEIKIPYPSAWESVTVTVARVVAPDGTVQQAGAGETHLMDAEWVASAPRYPASHILVVNLPGVKIGSRIEFEVVHEYRDYPFVADWVSFQDFDPSEVTILKLSAPAETGLRWLEPGASPAGPARAGDEAAPVWTAVRTPALPREESPAPLFAATPTVFFSSGRWADWTRRTDASLRAAAAGQAAVAEQARKILDPLPPNTPASERIRALRDFVATRIRAAGPGLQELPGLPVTPADRTLAEAYGHSADCAVLLFALLEAGGFAPRFVLASDPELTPDVWKPFQKSPQHGLFDALLVAVDADGRTYYLNDTDRYAPMGALTHELAQALDLASSEFLILQAAPGAETGTELAVRVELDEQGNGRMSVRRNYRGMDAAAFYRRWSEMTPELQRRYKLEEVSAISKDARPEGDWLVEQMAGASEIFALRIDRLAVRDGNRLYLTLPLTGANTLGLRSEARFTPYRFTGPARMEADLVLSFPGNLTVAELLPETLVWSAPGGLATGEYQAEFTREGEPRLSIRRSRIVKPGLLPAGDYPALFELNRRLSHPRNRTVMVRTAD